MTRSKFMGVAPLMEKKSFIKSKENINVSYDWVDVASGEGYVNFYGFASTSETAGTISYHASSNALHTKPQGLVSPNTTYNFITSNFNTPRRVGGTALIYLSRGAITGGSPSTCQMATSVTIYKVSGGADTSIGTIAAKSIDIAYSSNEIMDPDVLLCTIADTNLKIGDHLKFSVAITTGGAGAYNTVFSFDPSNTSFTATGAGGTITLTNTPLRFSIPFKIDT